MKGGHQLPEEPKLSRRDLAALKEKWAEPEDGQTSFRDLAMWFQMNEKVVKWIHFSGQRWKNPAKLSKNGSAVITQRWFVYVAILEHWSLDGKTRCVDLARLLGVSKSMIMRSIKDWNVEFGIYGRGQKRVSAHAAYMGADGTY